MAVKIITGSCGKGEPQGDVTLLIPWDGRNEEWLRDCVDSYPDGTPCVIAQNDSKTEMAFALNEALEAVNTEYVFVSGADDLAGPDMLQKLLDGIGDADGAYPRMELFGDREWTFTPPIWSKHILQFRNTCGVFLIKTSVLLAVGGWRTVVIEDWDLINRCAKAGYRFERIATAEYKYRQHSTSLSQRITRVAELEMFSADDQMREILGDKLERTPLEAMFYGQASMGQNYVRGMVPAEHLPGVCSDLLWEHNLDAPASVWLYPGQGSYDQAFANDWYGTRIVDVDDNYLSPRLVRELERAGRKPLAKAWAYEQPGHIKFVRDADAVFCATPHLVDVYSDHNQNVFLLRNGILEADWRRVRQPSDDGKLRIGWAAARQHEPDAVVVAKALRQVKRRHPHVDVHVLGFDPKWDFEYTWEPFTPTLAVYRQKLADFDISIAPLRRTEMNRGKSDLKWLESSMAGAAFVCSDYDPYDLVEDGVTGLKCAAAPDWDEALERVVVDHELRLGMAQAARLEVLRTRGAEKTAAAYRDALYRITLNQDKTPNLAIAA